MNKIYFCFTAVFIFTAVFSGCLDELNGNDQNDQLKKRLAELEAEVDGREDALRYRIADMQHQMRLDAITQQLAEVTDRQRLETIREQLRAERAMESGGIVPDIVWQLCLSAILVVFTVITIKALLFYFRGNDSKTIVCFTAPDSNKFIKIISENSDTAKLLEAFDNYKSQE